MLAASTLRITAGAVLNRVPPLIDFGLNLSGAIDLAGGSLLWRGGGSTPDFRTLLTRGYNAGAWNGTNTSGAINSSTAAASPFSDGVGYGLGSQIAPTTIGSFSIAAGDALIGYALDGDGNLSAPSTSPTSTASQPTSGSQTAPGSMATRTTTAW